MNNILNFLLEFAKAKIIYILTIFLITFVFWCAGFNFNERGYILFFWITLVLVINSIIAIVKYNLGQTNDRMN
jgi:hypothetical protein